MRSCFILLVSFLGLNTLAQDNLLLIESEEGKPLPYVYVTQTAIDGPNEGKVVKGQTNLDGQIQTAFENTFVLDVDYFGYEALKDTIDPSGNESKRKITLKPDAHTLSNVVVTAQFRETTAEDAVHRVKVIDRQRIEEQGAVTLNDVLSNETNMRISQDNILGTGMSMQGISGENVKILVDGVPMIGRLDGNIDLSQINLDNVERIEIIEGPLSVNYGTNALAGTINIITKNNQEAKLSGSATSYFESVGRANLSLQGGWRKDKHYVGVSGGRNFFNGWSEEDNSRFKQWKPKEQYFGNVQYKYSWDSSSVRWSGEAFNEKITNLGRPRFGPYSVTAFDDYYYTLRVNNGLFYQTKLNKNSSLDLVASYNYFRRIKNTYFKDLTSLEETMTDDASAQDTSIFDMVMSRGTYQLQADSNLNIQIGYDINIESSFGQRIEGETQQQGDFAGFMNVEWLPTKNFTIRPGIRYAYNTDYNAPVTPALNAKWEKGRSTIRASWSKGYRAPSLKEQYFYFVDINHNIQGNPDLQAETSDNFQFSINHQRSPSANMLMNLEASAFYNDINNMIFTAPTGRITNNIQEFTYVNIGTFRSYGSEFNVGLQSRAVNINVGYVHLWTYNQESENHDVPAYNSTPGLRCNISYEWKNPGINMALFYKYNGRSTGFYVDGDEEVQPTFIDAFQMADLTISKKLWKEKVLLQSGIKNLFDVTNINSQFTGGAHTTATGSSPVSWGRSYFLRLTVSL